MIKTRSSSTTSIRICPHIKVKWRHIVQNYDIYSAEYEETVTLECLVCKQEYVFDALIN